MVRQNSKSRFKESVSFSGIVSGCEDYGWTPSRMFLHTNPFVEEEDKADPLQEQVLIIKGLVSYECKTPRSINFVIFLFRSCSCKEKRFFQTFTVSFLNGIVVH